MLCACNDWLLKLFPDGPTHVCQGLVHHYKNVYAAESRGNINPLGSSDEDRENKALGTTSQNESFEDAIGVGDQDVKLVDDNKENPGTPSLIENVVAKILQQFGFKGP